MRFNSPYFHDDCFFSNPGREEMPDYQLAYNDDGIAYLKEVGVIPLYSKIQACRSECDLENVLRACVHDNQNIVPSLDYVETAITDFSKLHTLGDMFVAGKNLNSLWNDLPLEVRENFDGNSHKFITSIGLPDFNDKLVDGYTRFNDSLLKRLTPEKFVPSKPVPAGQADIQVNSTNSIDSVDVGGDE